MSVKGSLPVKDLSDPMSGPKLVEDFLQNIELPEEPPHGFNHLSAKSHELLKYGLPPSPDKEHFPEQYNQWKKIFSPPPLRAPSIVKAINKSFASPPVQSTLGQAEDDNNQDSSWCGAINRDLQDGYKFKRASASWTVPRPCPPNSIQTDSGWDSGDFSADIWVGIGGYGLYGYGNLRAGMTQRCVTSDDGVMQIITLPWISWSPCYRVEIPGFFVNPGDLVTVMIGDSDDFSYPSSVSSRRITKNFIFFYNKSTCTYFSAMAELPDVTSLQCGSVQWIIECPNDRNADQTMPYLGATFFYDCWAFAATTEASNSVAENVELTSEIWRRIDLSTATLVDLVQDGAVLSRAVRENDSVLGIFGEKRLGVAMVRSTKASPRTVVHWQSDAALAPLVYIPLATGKLRPETYVLIGTIHLGKENGEFYIHLNDLPPGDSSFDALWEEVKTLQFYGVKVLGRMGGADDGSFGHLDIPSDKNKNQPGDFESYYALLRAIIDNYQLDGLDLDVEEEMSPDGIHRIIDRLSSDCDNEFIITMSPVASALRGGRNLSYFSYEDLEKSRGRKISWYNAQFYDGWGSMADTTDYDNIIAKGFVSPSKVVAGVLTSKDTDAPLITLKTVLPKLMKKYPKFGSVAGWEYWDSQPRPVAPWEWVLAIQDILSTAY